MIPNVCIVLPNAFDSTKYLMSYYRGGMHRFILKKDRRFHIEYFFDSLDFVVYLGGVCVKLPETCRGKMGKNTLKMPKSSVGAVPAIFGTIDQVLFDSLNNPQKIAKIQY